MSAGQYHWTQNPIGLYRDTKNGKVAGVCAGLGAYFAIQPKIVRIAFILGAVFSGFWPVAAIYVILALLLRPMPDHAPISATEERFWRGVSASPDRTVSGLRDRFRMLDRRLADIESRVTSDEFNLRQKFRDLNA